MAATTENSAKGIGNVLRFIKRCEPVTSTDPHHRLPVISSDQLDGIFRHAVNEIEERAGKAA